MLRKILTAILCYTLLVNLIFNLAAATPANHGFGIYIDQDLFVPFYNEDRDYTMGFAVEFFWEKEKGIYPLDGVVRSAGKWLGMVDTDNNIVHSFMLGTVTYTPDNLFDPAPIFNDRPYSSLIYLSNKRVLANPHNAIATEMLVGVLGTNMAKSFQADVHSLYRDVFDSNTPIDPQGWSHQISDGGELTFRLRLANSRLKEELSRPGVWDITTSWGASLGYQTNANVSIAIRGGNIKSAFWSLPFDPVNRGNFLPSPAKREWYVWSALRANIIAYDALLQGQFRASDVTFSSSEIERFVYDGAIGLSLGYDKSQLTFSVNKKSPELKSSKRNQVWGGINYLYYF